MNFRIYWDGDAQDELLDGITITKRGNASPLGVGIVSITGQAEQQHEGHALPVGRHLRRLA